MYICQYCKLKFEFEFGTGGKGLTHKAKFHPYYITFSMQIVLILGQHRCKKMWMRDCMLKLFHKLS